MSWVKQPRWSLLTIEQIAAPHQTAIAIGPFGSRMKADCYVNEGIPVIRGLNLTSGRRFAGDFVYITEQKAEELFSANVFPGDLVFPHRGAIGEVGLVPGEPYDRWILSSSLMKLTCDEEKVDPTFVYYYFKTVWGRHELLKNASTVGTPGIGQPLTSLKGITVPVPPLPTQRRIAEILGRLDDKIEVNRQINRALEAMAQALFQHHFVDFGPYQAELVESEAGLIPRGWEVKPLSGLFEILSGGTPKTEVAEYWNGNIDWVAAKDVSSGTPFIMETERRITQLGVQNSSAKILPAFTTVITARGTVGEHALLSEKMAINQTNYGLKGKPPVGDFTTYLIIHDAVQRLKQVAYGTVFDTITRNTFESISFASPPKAVWCNFENKISPWFHQMLINQHQNRKLTEIRDYLLPRLLSGEVNVI